MILGDMFELGHESAQEHQQIIREVIETKIPAVFIGNQFFEQQIVHQSLLYFKNVSDFVEYLEKEQPKHSLLLIKGSRAMARSEEHTSELQSRPHLVCRLLLEKKNKDS